jgi:hypothetical protein
MDPYNSARTIGPMVLTNPVQPTAAEVAAVRKAIDLNRDGYHVAETPRLYAVKTVAVGSSK